MSAEELEGFGTLDGETIDLGTISLTGSGAVDRRYEGGERVVLIVEGTIADQVTLKRDDGRLVRVHKLKVSAVAPPGDQLADEVGDFLARFTDELEGRERLPFPGEGPEADGWEYERPEPAPDEDEEDEENG